MLFRGTGQHKILALAHQSQHSLAAVHQSLPVCFDQNQIVSDVLFGESAGLNVQGRIKEARYIFVGVTKEYGLVLVDLGFKCLRYADPRSHG